MIKHTVWALTMVGLSIMFMGCPELSFVISDEIMPPNLPELEVYEEFHEQEIIVEEQMPWTALAQEVHSLINEQRAAHGLSELFYDPALTTVAQEHSDDMARRTYFAHISPEGAGPSARLTQARIPWRALGENLYYALGYDEDVLAELAVAGWMESPGHRANIMNGAFTHTGLGIVCAEDGGYYLTQVFAKY